MVFRATGFAALIALLATGAQADFAKVDDKSSFMQIVNGKTLTRPFVRLEVTEDGRIEGKGLSWDVTGQWSWQDGYFCRDLYWGGDPLGYNCQEVRANGNEVRFTSDQGSGQSADFGLR